MESPLKILLIEKNSSEAESLSRRLKAEEFQIETASDLSTALALLKQGPVDVILLDLFLDASQGIDTFHQLRKFSPLPPCVILIDRTHMAAAVEAIKAGAADYWIKESDPQTIAEVLDRVVERDRIFSDWKSAVNQAFTSATRDPLTGLPNRSLFHDRLAMAISEARRHSEMLGIFFLDLDRLKEINDSLGHNAGDEALVSIALRFSESLRSEDTIARVGGDEFVALVRHLGSVEDARKVAGRFLASLDRTLTLKGKPFNASTSIGVSLYPWDGQSGMMLLKKADSALFRAKEKGGNGYEFFSKPEEGGSMNQPERTSGTKKILIVEDDEDVRLLLQKRLRSENYATLDCRSVEEAMPLLKTFKPDLVILDLGFRDASGLALLQNLSRYLDPNQPVPSVLVVSGYSDPEIVQFATTLGASGFIPKPIDAAKIMSAIHSLFQ